MHQPFRILRQLRVTPKKKAAAPDPADAQRTPPKEDAPVDETEMFRRAVADVQPLADEQRERVAQVPPASPAREITDADAEALAELYDLVSGTAPFDLSYSDETVEGALVGLDPRLLRRLRAGEFAYQAHVDLHGMNSEQARAAVDRFLADACQSGKRCVLIVHGRGRNSVDQVPVLKQRLTTWLASGRWAHQVLAFASARPCDGGAGALYVLLRRRKKRGPFRVTVGARW
jgi:DNA-nicking Smr family endonuclease